MDLLYRKISNNFSPAEDDYSNSLKSSVSMCSSLASYFSTNSHEFRNNLPVNSDSHPEDCDFEDSRYDEEVICYPNSRYYSEDSDGYSCNNNNNNIISESLKNDESFTRFCVSSSDPISSADSPEDVPSIRDGVETIAWSRTHSGFSSRSRCSYSSKSLPTSEETYEELQEAYRTISALERQLWQVMFVSNNDRTLLESCKKQIFCLEKERDNALEEHTKTSKEFGLKCEQLDAANNLIEDMRKNIDGAMARLAHELSMKAEHRSAMKKLADTADLKIKTLIKEGKEIVAMLSQKWMFEELDYLLIQGKLQMSSLAQYALMMSRRNSFLMKMDNNFSPLDCERSIFESTVASRNVSNERGGRIYLPLEGNVVFNDSISYSSTPRSFDFFASNFPSPRVSIQQAFATSSPRVCVSGSTIGGNGGHYSSTSSIISINSCNLQWKDIYDYNKNLQGGESYSVLDETEEKKESILLLCNNTYNEDESVLYNDKKVIEDDLKLVKNNSDEVMIIKKGVEENPPQKIDIPPMKIHHNTQKSTPKKAKIFRTNDDNNFSPECGVSSSIYSSTDCPGGDTPRLGNDYFNFFTGKNFHSKNTLKASDLKELDIEKCKIYSRNNMANQINERGKTQVCVDPLSPPLYTPSTVVGDSLNSSRTLLFSPNTEKNFTSEFSDEFLPKKTKEDNILEDDGAIYTQEDYSFPKKSILLFSSRDFSVEEGNDLKCAQFESNGKENMIAGDQSNLQRFKEEKDFQFEKLMYEKNSVNTVVSPLLDEAVDDCDIILPNSSKNSTVKDRNDLIRQLKFQCLKLQEENSLLWEKLAIKSNKISNDDENLQGETMFSIDEKIVKNILNKTVKNQENGDVLLLNGNTLMKETQQIQNHEVESLIHLPKKIFFNLQDSSVENNYEKEKIDDEKNKKIDDGKNKKIDDETNKKIDDETKISEKFFPLKQQEKSNKDVYVFNPTSNRIEDFVSNNTTEEYKHFTKNSSNRKNSNNRNNKMKNLHIPNTNSGTEYIKRCWRNSVRNANIPCAFRTEKMGKQKQKNHLQLSNQKVKNKETKFFGGENDILSKKTEGTFISGASNDRAIATSSLNVIPEIKKNLVVSSKTPKSVSTYKCTFYRPNIVKNNREISSKNFTLKKLNTSFVEGNNLQETTCNYDDSKETKTVVQTYVSSLLTKTDKRFVKNDVDISFEEKPSSPLITKDMVPDRVSVNPKAKAFLSRHRTKVVDEKSTSNRSTVPSYSKVNAKFQSHTKMRPPNLVRSKGKRLLSSSILIENLLNQADLTASSRNNSCYLSSKNTTTTSPSNNGIIDAYASTRSKSVADCFSYALAVNNPLVAHSCRNSSRKSECQRPPEVSSTVNTRNSNIKISSKPHQYVKTYTPSRNTCYVGSGDSKNSKSNPTRNPSFASKIFIA